MNDNVYHRLASVLDTLPNGFPSSKNGVEIKLLKKIFTPEQADLFCDLRLTFETAEQIARRTGRPLEGLEKMLKTMGKRGQIFAIHLDEQWFFRMLPWIFGIYEFQLGRLDLELAELNEEYAPIFADQFYKDKPQLMQVLPIEEEISVQQEALPYERVSAIIEQGQSFRVSECICKKEQGLLGKPCDRPVQVCMAIAPIPGIFKNSAHDRVLTRDEAYDLLRKSEEAALVHLTSNIRNGHIYICNCCKCCCGVLRSINELGIPAGDVVNSHYYAEIDAEECISCGVCKEQRCQVGAIEEAGDAYLIIQEKCIGCGLCVSTCPTSAIRLVHKEPDRRETPPITEDAWFEEKGRHRGVDFTKYK